MKKFFSPTNDIVFKKVFGDDKKTHILISFLNAVLKYEGDDKIKEVKLTNTYVIPKVLKYKETALDIKATNEKGEEFIVEMQNANHENFLKRSLFYSSNSYSNQIKKGESYDKLKTVIFIGIMGYNLFTKEKDLDKYLSTHLLLNKETLSHEMKDFEFHFIELQNLIKQNVS
ncbi:MAG: Rpn family recombination-promoting nuclease/putative transposase [Candidatus Gracilibacteria bacterium]|nr:Rpn family recombination-promoting nuclease/putative transposase [Candidatus Gracilibacteria bacterium]